MHHVIAIGASAGGLEALRRFFSAATRSDPVSYVVAQHLSPHHRSLMPELLSRHCDVEMHAAEDDQLLEPGHAYLLPPGFDMEIRSGKLKLMPRRDDGNLHLPIDRLFSSLAEEQGPRAAAVVLSGLGSDGTAGLRDIKAVGGVVAAQEPGTAQFDGMPGNAIATGLVDLVAPPEQLLPSLLQAVQRPPPVVDDSTVQHGQDKDALERILWAVAQHAGMDFTDYKHSTLLRRMERRMRVVQCDDLASYADLLADDPREAVFLHREMLINVTRFFRDSPVFEYLRSEIIPELVRRASSGERLLRVWSVGCATGEEAYSVALMVRDAMDRSGNETLNVKIFATDVDQDAIDEAGSGVFSATLVSEIPDDLVQRYFSRRDEAFVIQRAVRDMVVFARHNALEDPPLTRMDMVLCRNMLIYLETEAQQHMLRRLSFALHPGGVMVLGSSETVGELVDRFEIIDRRLRIYRSRGRMLPVGISQPTRRAWQRRKPPRSTDNWADPAVDKARETLLETYVPPAILVDEEHHLVHVFSSGSDVLKLSRGPATLDISTVLPRSAASAINAAIHRAFESGEDVLIPALRLWPDSSLPVADVRLRPLREGYGAHGRLLLMFESPLHLALTDGSGQTPTSDLDELAQERIRFLEDGLARTQERLQATIEELESSNEELQATNEELLSANEELQSTNEELQSVNEELHTVNAEYQNKIRELSQVNADMDNLFQSTAIGTLFLDRDFKVRRFTSAAAEFLPLLPRDLDRPIAHFARHLPGLNLDAESRRIFDSGQSVEHEVRLLDDRVALVRMSVFRDGSGDKGGVVLNFVEITRLRSIERNHTEVLDGLPEQIAVVDGTGVITFVNQAWKRFALMNGASDDSATGLGANYLEVAKPISGLTDTFAEKAAQGVHGVLDGALSTFALEYPCHSPSEERWFIMRVAPLTEGGGAVISHQDVSTRRLVERLAASQAARLGEAPPSATPADESEG